MLDFFKILLLFLNRFLAYMEKLEEKNHEKYIKKKLDTLKDLSPDDRDALVNKLWND